MNLRLDLDVPPQQDPQLHHQTRNPRNGPAQQRCRERQSAARQAAAEAAEASVSPEEREVLHMAAGAVQVAEEATKTVKVAKDTERTFCKRSYG